MDICVLGPGRAGLAIAIAAAAAGHRIVGLVGRDFDHLERALQVAEWDPEAPRLGIADAIPPCDLLVIAVRDDEIAGVAEELAGGDPALRNVVHLSGLRSVNVLDPLAPHGATIGSFHPLQTLPTPKIGSARLAGAWAGITAPSELAGLLGSFAESLGMRPFVINDSDKAVYHAAAAAAANFPLAALTMAADLFAAAGVPFAAAHPLVAAVIANAFELGPRAALTGPVARGDVATVRSQLQAVAAADSDWLPAFASFVAELARLTGRGPQFSSVADDLGDIS